MCAFFVKFHRSQGSNGWHQTNGRPGGWPSTTIPYRHWTPKMHRRGHHLDIFGLHNYIECSHLKLCWDGAPIMCSFEKMFKNRCCSCEEIVRNQQRFGKVSLHRYAKYLQHPLWVHSICKFWCSLLRHLYSNDPVILNLWHVNTVLVVVITMSMNRVVWLLERWHFDSIPSQGKNGNGVMSGPLVIVQLSQL